MAGELMGPRVDLLLFCYVDIMSNCSVNLYLCTHRSVLLSELIRKVFLCNRGWLMQKLIIGPCTKNNCLWMSMECSTTMEYLYLTLSPKIMPNME